jgi:RNA polymerase sigma factor (sigma-70 family)
MTPSTSRAASNERRRDKTLALAVYRKDRKATADFVEQYSDAVYGYVFSRLRPNFADAEDLTQEVFLAACRSVGDYRGSSSLRGWMLGIARHKVEDYYRARMPESELEAADEIPAGDWQLDAELDQNRLRQRIMAVLDELPEQYRLLLKWRYWDQRTTAEIAEALGRTEKAVERMLARSRERFRREWEAKP